MALNDHVSITITQNTVGIARAAFGVALLASANAPFVERTKTYSDVAEVGDDYATDEPEYLAAQAYFSQAPHASKLKIGRCALPPTLRYSLNVVTVRDEHTYQILVKGTGVTETTVEFESDEDATDAEIAAGLVSALNDVTGANFTAAGSSSPFTVTGDAAGNWFSLEILDRSDLSTEVNHADPGIATDLAAIKVADNDWYELLTVYNSSAYVLAAAAWVESNDKRYRAECNDTTALSATVGSGTDVIDDLFTAQRERTLGAFHSDPSAMFAAAWSGRVLAADPGTINEGLHTLSGVPAVSMTTTERTNLTNKRGSSYENAGVNVTFGGQSSMSSRWFDTVRDKDALRDDIQKSIMEGLAARDKTEYSDVGITEVEADLRGALRRNTRSPGSGPRILQSYTVTLPKFADISTANKSNRLLPDVKFAGVLGEGIYKVNVIGTVSV